MGLTAVEMESVGELINESFLSVASNLPQAQMAKILTFAFGLVKQEVPYHLFNGNSLEGVKRANSLMFDDADTRDFVLKVTFHFFAKFGNTTGRYEALVENLAEAIGFLKPVETKERASLVVAHQEFMSRMPSVEDVRALLMDNRWMVTMALMMLYLITPEDLAELYREWQSRQPREKKPAPQS
jgi:hypothetical protein